MDINVSITNMYGHQIWDYWGLEILDVAKQNWVLWRFEKCWCCLYAGIKIIIKNAIFSGLLAFRWLWKCSKILHERNPNSCYVANHDDFIKWKHVPCYWPFVRGIHRSPVNSPHKGQWRGALMFSLICSWINGWEDNGEAGDLRCNHAHYDVTVIHWQTNRQAATLTTYWWS